MELIKFTNPINKPIYFNSWYIDYVGYSSNTPNGSGIFTIAGGGSVLETNATAQAMIDAVKKRMIELTDFNTGNKFKIRVELINIMTQETNHVVVHLVHKTSYQVKEKIEVIYDLIQDALN